MTGVQIDRAFVRLREGLVHLRRVPATAPDLRPLVMLHLSPSSSRSLEPLMTDLREVGFEAELIAPDTLGNGDSAAPEPDSPDIAYFADSLARVLDGLGVGEIDLFGSHTGARTACEFAVRHPDRVGRMVLDGIAEYSPETRALFRQRYVPNVEPDMYGRQMVWGFNFARDQHLFFPYFQQDKEHRLTKDVPSPDALHLSALDVLKSLKTYHKPYLAAFEYDTRARIADLTVKTRLLKPEDGTPILNAWADRLAEDCPFAEAYSAVGGRKGFAQAVADHLRKS